MKIEEVLKDIFPETSEEFSVIKETYELFATSAPTIAAECKTIMILSDNLKPKLSTLYFILNRKISEIKNQLQPQYDAQYVRLVKMGRPSNAAIESEIRMTNPDYVTVSQKIETYEQVKELINSYIRSIDSLKQSAIEILRDSRRID